jgi:N-acetyl-1-D-myo-inositol-2-amino-2-deoxy-alpha-D-glucopyranoside deacetylase
VDRTILAIFAHPDDEAFGTGGTLAKYALEGDRVYLVCATGGEAGLNRLDEHDLERLGDLRSEELRRACEQLGIEAPLFMGYRDSGMAGTPENQHLESLNLAPLDEVAEKLREIIAELRPDALITFERYGWYGHPDHVKVYQAVRAALEGLEDAPPLFCAAMPAEAARYSAHLMEQAGEEVPAMFSNPDRLRYSLDMIPIVVDTSELAARKIAALNEHRTQMGPTGVEGRWLPEVMRVRTDREYFMPSAHHDALPDEILPFERAGGLFGEPPPDPLVPYPIIEPLQTEHEHIPSENGERAADS